MRHIVSLTALDVSVAIVLDGLDSAEAVQFVQSWSRCGARAVSEIPRGSTVIRARLRMPGQGQVQDEDARDLTADSYRELADRLSGLVTLRAIDARRQNLLMFHAGGVADLRTGNVIAFIGPSGRGKTTASIALGKTFGYVTDETLAVSDDLGVLAYAKPLSVKQAAPERWKDQFGPAALGLAAVPARALRLVRIVLLDRQSDYAEGVRPLVRPVPLASVIAELVPQISFLAERARPLHRLRSTIDRCGGLQQVTYGEATSLTDVFRALFAEAEAEQDGLSGDNPTVFFEAEYDDAVLDDESLIVLRQGTVRVLAGIAPTLLELAAVPVSFDDLVRGVVDIHGMPGRADARVLVGAAVDELVASGLLRASTPRAS
ncbi:hypothetical protein [Subtercola boreus]|nr:hypothetical protein [Subtercola boreus]TQL54745.1 hypothetical protein FB464_2289 [Subtercola boreus]